ncbi:MAG: family 78 glycoside hydrolase catalytic domain [Armatimonadetes bacterium]|nr:family 78 glycoside hydrolase catalytic domain [Armatimonadota bacterium]
MSALLAAFVAMSTPSNSALNLANLRCEYLAHPLAVETTSPRLSWITETSTSNWRQSAYQILVASTADLLKGDKGDLWDTGKVASDASTQIAYAGHALSSRQPCFWKVRVWDKDGNASGWSKPQEWEMGLLHNEDWGASEWIGIPGEPKVNPAPYLRKEFTVSGRIKRARLTVCGLAYADMSLNGKLVGDTERDPGYTNFDKRVLYVVHDVTAALHSGKNCLGAVLGTGWYDVHDLATWRFEKAPWRDRPKLRAVLRIEYADGKAEDVVTDETWRATTGPILFDGIYTGEVYDASKELTGWDKAGFDDSAWGKASEMAVPKGELHALPCPPVRITQTLKPKTISEPQPGVYVLDYGQNLTGHVRIHGKFDAGQKVTMRYSERIDAKGMIHRDEIDVYMDKATPPQPFQTDVYIAKGKGTEQWEQRFSYSGFQYVEVTGLKSKPTPDMFEARFAHTDLASAGEFSCSNDLLNKIQHATRYSYLSNAQSIPTDCPQREKNGWTGDAHLACEAGLMNFDSASFYTKWLGDYADDQKPSGAFSLIIPSGGWGNGATHPSWDSAFGIIANDMTNYLGDERILRQAYPHVKRYLDHLYGMAKDEVVDFDSLGDWLPWKTETSSKLTSSVMLYLDATIVARGARLSGETAEAEKYEAMAARVKDGIDRHFYDPAKFGEDTQTALALAIYFDLVPADQKQAALDALVKNVESQGHIDTGIIGAKFILRALSENGRTDVAYKIVNHKGQPGWGWWMEQGATTLWEDWKGEFSMNHIMFGDVSNWFMQWLAGIGLDPATPAFKHILIRPTPVGDLTWAKGAHLSPYGWIRSSWTKDAKGFRLSIEIPANTTATVTLPSGKTQEVGSGKWSFAEQLVGSLHASL